MKAYILDTGYLACDQNWIVAMKTYATVDNLNPKRIWTKMPVYCVLIDHPEGKIIFDMGCDPDINNFMKRIGRHQAISFPYICTPEQSLENQLALCKTKPEDIKAIILSHLHYDHVGNLPLFHGIDVYVNKADYESALKNGPSALYFDQYIKEPDVNFILTEHSFTLAEGIDIIALGSSHCAGLLGLLLHLKEETLFFPSDVLYSKENYGPPLKPSGKVYDSLGYIKVADKIRNLVEKHNAKIMYPHDIAEFQTYKKAPNYYE